MGDPSVTKHHSIFLWIHSRSAGERPKHRSPRERWRFSSVPAAPTLGTPARWGQVGMGAVHWLCLLPALPKSQKETNSKFNDGGEMVGEGGGGESYGSLMIRIMVQQRGSQLQRRRLMPRVNEILSYKLSVDVKRSLSATFEST